MMTGNSRYKEKFIDEFASLLKNKNASFIDLLFIKRGRVFWQKTPGEVNQEVAIALQKNTILNQFRNAQ